MENQTKRTDVFTKVNEVGERGVFLNGKDAEEYRAFKRRKKMTEVTLSIARSEGSLFCGEDIQRVCERALRLKQAAIRLPLSKITQAKSYLASGGVKLDCAVGGNGETLGRVKAYEARLAVKKGAKEITVALAPSLVDGCRYHEIRKELKGLKRAVGKAALKVRVDKIGAHGTLSRVARICSEVGAAYLCVPFFIGCERLRLDLTNGCMLEVYGVERVETFQKLTENGVERIGTDKAWEIYNDWMREASETPVAERVLPTSEGGEKEEEKVPACVSAAKILAAHERAKEEEKTADDKQEQTETPPQKGLEIKLL